MLCVRYDGVRCSTIRGHMRGSIAKHVSVILAKTRVSGGACTGDANWSKITINLFPESVRLVRAGVFWTAASSIHRFDYLSSARVLPMDRIQRANIIELCGNNFHINEFGTSRQRFVWFSSKWNQFALQNRIRGPPFFSFIPAANINIIGPFISCSTHQKKKSEKK